MNQSPVAKDIVLTTGLHMHYLEWEGSGPTLIFLHPSSGYSRMWEFTASHLSRDFHIIALDQRGHGDSSRPDGSYSAEEYAEDLQAFTEAKGIKQAILAGHSLGGRVAQVFASTCPHSIQALILVAGPHYESFFQEAHIVDTVLQGVERMRTSPREFDTEEEIIRFCHEMYPTLPDEAIRHRAQYNFKLLPNGKYGPKYDPLRVAQGLTHMPDNLTRYAKTITCPVAFVVGSRSQLTQADANRMADCFQKTDVKMYEADAATVLQVEDPDGLAKAIKEFLTSTL